jgi:hypothetical protein
VLAPEVGIGERPTVRRVAVPVGGRRGGDVYIAWEGLPGVATMKRSHLKLANRHERWLAERVAQHDQQVTQVAVARPSPRREPAQPSGHAWLAG